METRPYVVEQHFGSELVDIEVEIGFMETRLKTNKMKEKRSQTEHLLLGPVLLIPGQLIAPGQLTDPWVNFASVHGLTPVTNHMSFSLPRGNFERRDTRCPTPGCRLAEVTFLHLNRT